MKEYSTGKPINNEGEKLKKILNHTLLRIKKLMKQENYRFTFKADLERQADGLDRHDIINSILNADDIAKTLNSNNPKTGEKEKLYIIKGVAYNGVFVYTKGKIMKDKNQEFFYIFISSKRSL